MRTTVEIGDNLFRRAKAEAALRGIKFKDLVESALAHILESPDFNDRKTARARRPSLHDLMKDYCGVVDSGIDDLASRYPLSCRRVLNCPYRGLLESHAFRR